MKIMEKHRPAPESFFWTPSPSKLKRVNMSLGKKETLGIEKEFTFWNTELYPE